MSDLRGTGGRLLESSNDKRIRRHLLDQFMKWNARHPKTAEEREIISRQLEAVARLRKRYL